MPNETDNRKALDLPALRERMANTSGKEYWRSLEEVAATDEFRDMVDREFPERAPEWLDPVSRRNFLKLMGASLALAGVGACTRQPDEKIVPYVKAPEQFVPGKPLFFATAIPMRGYALGVLAENHMGRPTKLEGNPDHPASLGATDSFTQAAILSLYDPDRSPTVTHKGNYSTWEAFLSMMAGQVGAWKASGGAGVRILTETVTSPTLADQIRRFLAAFPAARWHQYDAASRDNVREGSRMAFGEYVETIYRFDRAEVVLSLDADFLLTIPGSVRYSRDFVSRRRVSEGARTMNRLYAVESSPTITGAMADHRAALTQSQVMRAAWAIAGALGVGGNAPAGGASPEVDALAATWIPALVRDLKGNPGRSIVIAGDEQPPVVHALAHAINSALGNVGQTVLYTDSIEAEPVNQHESLAGLARDIDAGQVSTLIMIGGNPAYNAPADLAFADRLAKVKLRVHLSPYHDETSYLSHWHIPEAHPLEAWGDARAFDGTVTIMQPLIAPLYGGKSVYEVMAVLLGEPSGSSYDIVRAYWQGGERDAGSGTIGAAAAGSQPAATGSAGATTGAASNTGSPAQENSNSGSPATGTGTAPAGDRARAGSATPSRTGSAPRRASAVAGVSWQGGFDRGWNDALFKGVVPGTTLPTRGMTPRTDLTTGIATPPPSTTSANAIELMFRLDPTILDGRFANNGWLQELPKPLSKITWDNALMIAPKTAERLGVESEDMVDLVYRERTLRVPVWVLPGHPENSGTLTLGYGRTRVGRVGNNVGFNTYMLRTSDAPWGGMQAEVRPAGETYPLAVTQSHHSMEGRDILRSGSFADFVKNPKFLNGPHDELKIISLYPEYDYKNGYAWGMAIDLNSCIGCNACTIACQAENNIPVVGKDQVKISREMHWIRIDRYYKGDIDHPETLFQPLPCMHCEKAPCEPVCPVGATVHSDEGLNDMVYNRCIGTRYCSNNCPYKVRRFNFLKYNDEQTPSLAMGRNPDVSVRSRGVMEKCTYCVQRINNARIEAKKLGREIIDGEVVSACAQVCPTEAIVFGDINDPNSRVAKLKSGPLNYGLLAELGTQPRTSYVAKLRNPNPEIERVAS